MDESRPSDLLRLAHNVVEVFWASSRDHIPLLLLKHLLTLLVDHPTVTGEGRWLGTVLGRSLIQMRRGVYVQIVELAVHDISVALILRIQCCHIADVGLPGVTPLGTGQEVI